MTTQTGRVVYEREKHTFSNKAVARIIRKISASESVADVSKTFAKIQIEYLKEADVSYVMKIGFLISMLIPMATYINLALDELLDALRKAHEILTESWF